MADFGSLSYLRGKLNGPAPCIGSLVGAIWSLIARFVTVRQGLDLDNTKAFLTILIGFVVYLVGVFIIALFIGGVSALFS